MRLEQVAAAFEAVVQLVVDALEVSAFVIAFVVRRHLGDLPQVRAPEPARMSRVPVRARKADGCRPHVTAVQRRALSKTSRTTSITASGRSNWTYSPLFSTKTCFASDDRLSQCDWATATSYSIFR